MVAIPMPAAGAGVGGCHQGYRGREAGFQPCSAEAVHPLLQWLPKLVQHGALEFSKLIEKKHPPMGQAEFSRSWIVSTTEQGRSGAAVVWSPEGTFAERFQRVLLFTSHRTDARDGQGFLRFQRWEQLWELMGQSAFAAAWRPDQ